MRLSMRLRKVFSLSYKITKTKKTQHVTFSILIKFYILTKLFYYFHEYCFLLQQKHNMSQIII